MRYQSKLAGTIKLHSPPTGISHELDKFAIAVGVSPDQIRAELEEYIRVNGESPDLLKAFIMEKAYILRRDREAMSKAWSESEWRLCFE